MHIWNDTKKLCNPNARYTNAEGTGYDKVPADLYTEIPEDQPPTPPEGFSVDEAFWRRENWETTQRPYITWEPKTDDELRVIWNNKIDRQIRALEERELMPRLTRDLTRDAAITKAGLLMGMTPAPVFTPAQQAQIEAAMLDTAGPLYVPGYAKFKAFDDEIAQLRAKRK